MGSLDGKVAIVTGASSGIGKAIAEELAREGAAVVLAARRADRLAAIASAIRDRGGEAVDCPADVTREDAVDGLFESTLERFGRLDILVNSAGIADHTPTDELPLARWREVIDSNLTSAFLCSRAALRVMKPRRRGRIVNVGSLSSRVPRPNSAAYSASKFALDGLNRSLAIDGRPFGISASIIHPGLVATELTDGLAAVPNIMPPEVVARIVLSMVTVPDDLNFMEALVLQIDMPFLGRG